MIPLRVSCIVPVFNGERYLPEALDSILAQSHRPLEIIIVDDGSTDRTPEIARELDGPVRYLRQPNAGPATARNTGIDAATGDLVAFLDHDDLWHPDKLARQVTRFAVRPELDACVTHASNFWISELGKEAERQRDDPRARGVPGFFTSALVVRRPLFERVGRFDPARRHSDDTDWFLRASDQGAIIEVLPDVLTYHRMHHSNMAHIGAAECRHEYLSLLKQSLDRRRARGTSPAATWLA
jgi:glycosyltransferase involved in cell wall biosynthesis